MTQPPCGHGFLLTITFFVIVDSVCLTWTLVHPRRLKQRKVSNSYKGLNGSILAIIVHSHRKEVGNILVFLVFVLNCVNACVRHVLFPININGRCNSSN